MHALVTGAAGFIGSHLSKELLMRGYAVKGLLLHHEDGSGLEELGMEIVRGDLTNPDSLKGVCRDIDTVFHLATRTLDWGSYKQFERVMVDGTLNLLNEARGQIKRFVYFSSIAAFGLHREMVGFREDMERAKCGIPYCDTKIVAEDSVKAFCTRHSIAYTIIRPANVIGPGSVWVKEILDAFRRGPFPLINRGSAPGAFVFVDNLIDGTILASEAEVGIDKTYHFRDDYPITWGDYLRALGGWIGKKPLGNLSFRTAWLIGSLCEKCLAPLNIRPPVSRLAAGVMGLNNEVDNRLAKVELGWKSTVSQEETLVRIRQWVETIYLSSKSA